MDATDEVNALDKSSDSEGICADYASKTDEPPEMLTSTFDFGDVRIPCQKITRTVSSRSSGLSMSMVTYKSPSPTRIPTLMSKSFSVTCAKKALDESCGSREQLCDDFSDVSADAKRLLQRSRERKKHRANSFDPRCLFALNYSSPMAMSTSQRAPSRTRLLNRPQWIRHLPTSSTNALQTSTVWPQQRCNNIASQQHEPTNSIYCRVRRNKEGGLQRPKPWQVVRLGRLRCSTCSKCRHANRLRRLAISSAKITRPRLICKRNTTRRDECICDRRDDVAGALPSPPSAGQACLALNWAFFFAFVAFVLRILQILVELFL